MRKHKSERPEILIDLLYLVLIPLLPLFAIAVIVIMLLKFYVGIRVVCNQCHNYFWYAPFWYSGAQFCIESQSNISGEDGAFYYCSCNCWEEWHFQRSLLHYAREYRLRFAKRAPVARMD